MRNLLSLPVGALLLASLSIASPARADTLILKEKDGTSVRIEGKLIERRENDFLFEHSMGGTKVRSTFARADVASVLVDVVDAPLTTRTREPQAAPNLERHHPRNTPETRPSSATIPEEYPELDAKVRNVVIVLDRSSAMLAGARWKTGLNVVESIIDHLPPKATFGVYIYDEAAYSVLGTNYVSQHEAKRFRLHETLERLGVNPWDRGNIRAGLMAAYENRPDAIYLVSAGVVPDSHEETEAFVRMMTRLHPTSKKFPVHVVSVLGGKTADADDGTEARRDVLGTIATGLFGVYREVLLDNVPGTTRRRVGGGRPQSSKKTTGSGPGGSFGGGFGGFGGFGGGGGGFGGGGGAGGMQMDAAAMAAWRARHGGGGGGGGSATGQGGSASGQGLPPASQSQQAQNGNNTTVIFGQ